MNTLDVTNAEKPRQKSGPCSECNYTKKKEDPYQGYCGNCFQIHEFPNCVQCQQYRIKPGRCTNCGVVGPDNTEWIYTCLGQDDEYETIMTPILEARKKKIAEETKKFTTYKNCPLCRGYFHAAKACIFRTHVKHFNILKRRMELYSDEVNSTTRMYVPTTNLDSDSDSQDEEACDFSNDESDEEECYMIVTHHGNSSEEESMDEDTEDPEDDFSSRLKQITRFEKVLTIVTKQKKIHQDEEDQDEEDQDEDDQDGDEQTKDDQREDSDDEDQDPHEEGQSGEEQQEDQEEEAYEDYPDQDQDQPDQQDQQNEDQMDTDSEDGVKIPTLTEVKFIVLGDNPDETSCELSRRSFNLQDSTRYS